MLKKMGINFILLQKSIGALEVTCGTLMTLVPGSPKDVAIFSLLLLVLGVLSFIGWSVILSNVKPMRWCSRSYSPATCWLPTSLKTVF